MSKTKRLTVAAILAGLALVTFVIEAQIPPPVPLPGIKLGLANLYTLMAASLLGRKGAGAVLAVRILLGSLFCGTVTSLLYSAAGGLCCYLVTILLYPKLGDGLLWAVSVAGALSHNLGQLLVAFCVIGRAVLYYAPALAAAAVIAGAAVGVLAGLLAPILKKRGLGKPS
ncbi:MAG: Gx transporter family protein [Clostridia bacterium]|nr:Gx transporter family protein [Clostridia bacterium]